MRITTSLLGYPGLRWYPDSDGGMLDALEIVTNAGTDNPAVFCLYGIDDYFRTLAYAILAVVDSRDTRTIDNVRDALPEPIAAERVLSWEDLASPRDEYELEDRGPALGTPWDHADGVAGTGDGL